MSAGTATVEKVLTRAQACRTLKVSDETIRRWVSEGKLLEQQFPAKSRYWVRYAKSEIERVKEYRENGVPLPVVSAGS
jgi:predicted site-specific integrase-resolvase